jgi:2-iminobutanoate/2-iminopropanoate deaminase
MKKTINTMAAPLPNGHYSQAIRAGSFVFIAGQLPLNAAGKLVEGDITRQAMQAFSNIKYIVEAAGGKLGNIVQCTIYLSDLDLWTKVDEAYASFFSGLPAPPARAIIPVKQMHYGSQIEIQAIAYLD